MGSGGERLTLGRALGRGLLLRCPRCGEGRLFSGWFSMNPQCSVCSLNFGREQGYYVGAMYVNYGLTTAIGLAAGLLLLDRVPLKVLLGSLGVFGIVFPLAFFRHSRSLWLACEQYIVDRVRS